MSYILYKIINLLFISQYKKHFYSDVLFSKKKYTIKANSKILFDFSHSSTHLGDRLFFLPLIKGLQNMGFNIYLSDNDQISDSIFKTLDESASFKKANPSINFDLVVIPAPTLLAFHKIYRGNNLVVCNFTDIRNRSILEELNEGFSKLIDSSIELNRVVARLEEKYDDFLDDDEKYYLFSNYIDSGWFRSYFINEGLLEIKAKHLTEKGYKIIHVGSLGDLEKDNNKSLIKKINIKKSNIFIRNKKNEIISIIKIPAGFISYDELNLVNTLNIKGKIFNVPFVFELINDLSSSNFDEINIRSKKINLFFSNSLTEKNKKTINGLNILKFFNLKLVTDYQYEKNSIKFNSIKSQTKKTGINYAGEVSLNPFNLLIDLDLQRVNFFKFINPNSIFLEFIKNNILFNKNLSAKINVKSKDIKANKFFDTMKVIFNIKNGKIDLNQTFLTNHDIGSLKVKNSDFYFLDNKLIFSTDVNIDLKNLDNFYSLLQTPKKIRKKINNISINFSHDFLENHTIINSFTINNLETNDNIAEILQDFNNQESKNFIKSRGFVNKLLQAYSG